MEAFNSSPSQGPYFHHLTPPGVPGRETEPEPPQLPAPTAPAPPSPAIHRESSRKEGVNWRPFQSKRPRASASPELKTHGETEGPPPLAPPPLAASVRLPSPAPSPLPPASYPRDSASSVPPATGLVVPSLFLLRVEAADSGTPSPSRPLAQVPLPPEQRGALP